MGMVMVTLVVVVVVVMMVMMIVFDGSVKKNTETLLVTHYLVMSLVKECMFISGTENKGQIHKVKTGNKSFETANFRHLEMTITNHNCMCEQFGGDQTWRMSSTIWFRIFCLTSYTLIR
jgi:hypothetical protein